MKCFKAKKLIPSPTGERLHKPGYKPKYLRCSTRGSTSDQVQTKLPSVENNQVAVVDEAQQKDEESEEVTLNPPGCPTPPSEHLDQKNTLSVRFPNPIQFFIKYRATMSIFYHFSETAHSFLSSKPRKMSFAWIQTM